MTLWRGGCRENTHIKVYRTPKEIMGLHLAVQLLVLPSRWVGSWERGENKEGGGHGPVALAFALHFKAGKKWDRQGPGLPATHANTSKARCATAGLPLCFGRPGYSPSDGRVHLVHQRHRQREGVVMQGLGALHVATAREGEGGECRSVPATRQQACLFRVRPQSVTLRGLTAPYVSSVLFPVRVQSHGGHCVVPVAIPFPRCEYR